MKDFLFGPEQANTPVGVLSGGERGRLTLARAFARPSNLLVLDEPTNDLDLETLDLLQERLAEYAGTVLLVSHDRDFLDRVVTSMIAAEGDGRWIEYAGGYTDMLAQRGPGSAERYSGRDTAAACPAGKAATGRPAASDDVQGSTCAGDAAGADSGAAGGVARLNAALADLDLYARDPARFGDDDQGAGGAQNELAAAEEQWLTLEMLREEIEG